MILDIHTHKPSEEGILNISSQPSSPLSTLRSPLSMGFHPWEETPTEEQWRELEKEASRPEVAAIGECGIDRVRAGAPLPFQLLTFRRHVELSERLKKPLIIHAVKADDIILGLHRDLRPTQPWIIHGFRGKPAAAEQYLRAGILLSFGEKFNPESLRLVGADRLLSETDESELSIHQVIALQAAALGMQSTDLEAKVNKNLIGIIAADSK